MASVVFAAGLAVNAHAAPAEPVAVGQAKVVVRTVTGIIEETRRPVSPEDSVYWRELIETGADSAAQMVFLDDTTLTTGPNSRVQIDEFVYAGGSEGRRMAIDLGRGILRIVTGTSPSAAYQIRTPSAIIGVRGTDFSIQVDEVGATRVDVRRGAIEFAGRAPGAGVVVREGQSSAVPPGGVQPPTLPVETDPGVAAATVEMTALLATGGEGERSAVVPEGEVRTLGGLGGVAGATRAATRASQVGPSCGGC